MILFKLGSILFRIAVKAVTPFNAKAKLKEEKIASKNLHHLEITILPKK